MIGENHTLMDNYSDPTTYSFSMLSYVSEYYKQYYRDELPPYGKRTYTFLEIRLSIFLITSVCVGLPALVWAFLLLHLHRKIRGRISAFILILLLSDLIQLLLNLYTVIQILTDLHWSRYLITQYGSAISVCGFHLHQLVALEGVLTLKYPMCSAHIFSLPCYIIIAILILVLFFIPSTFIFSMYPFNNESVFFFSIGTSLAPLSLLAVTYTITCKAPPTPVRKNTFSVFIVSIVTSMLYLPFMLIICVNFFMGRDISSYYVMSVCLMILRAISDPLLCVLVCRGNLRDVQTPQTHTEPNTDQNSV